MSYFAITSNKPRHIKFLEILKKHVDLSTIIVVPKNNPDAEFTRDERMFFPDCETISDKIYVKCTKNNLESDLIVESLRKIKPKVGFIFGAPLISKKIYDIPEYGCVNIHTGLVQHYRGVDSSSWALYDNRLDLIGTTLHYIDDSIDAGKVICQKKIEIASGDTPNNIFFKTCQAGFDLISENISDIINNTCVVLEFGQRGKLYQKKDMTLEIKNDIKKNFNSRIKEYIK